jgi:hypothetical protein
VVWSPEECPPERDAGVCDHFIVTAAVAPAYWRARDGGLRITITWEDREDEFNLHVFRKGVLVATSAVLGAGMEQVTVPMASGGYEVRVTPVKVTGSGYRGTAELLSERRRAARPVNNAYHGARIRSRNPRNEPHGRPASYRGPPLEIRTTDVGRNALEPTIGIGPRGAAFYTAAAWDCPAPYYNYPRDPGRFLTSCPDGSLMRSTDGGRSWKDISPELQPATSDRHPLSYDPFLYVARTGRIFLIDLTGLTGPSELSVSDDGGRSFDTTIVDAPGIDDRESITSGPIPEGPLVTTDPSFDSAVYYCVNQFTNHVCMLSLDGGQTFAPTTPLPNFTPNCVLYGAPAGDVLTDRDGRVFLPMKCSTDLTAYVLSLSPAIPALWISEDAGATWDLVPVSQKVGTHYDGQTQVAADVAGNLYAVWVDDRHDLPYLSTSTDHGRTWSSPLMIAPPGVREVQFATVAAGDRGRVAVSFLGTTVNDRMDKSRPWNAYVIVTSDGLSRDPLFVSAMANPGNDPVHRGDCPQSSCAYIRDFLDVQISPFDGTVWATAVDTCTAILECNRKDVEGMDWDNDVVGAAVDSRGIAIHEISGPRLLTPGSKR